MHGRPARVREPSGLAWLEAQLAHLGAAALQGVAQIGRLSLMLGNAFRWILRGRLEFRETILQLNRVGVESVGIMLLTGAFTGMVVAQQTAPQFITFGATGFVGGLVGVSMAREAGPMFTAITAAGKIGASMAAEIGTMAVTEQIDALRVLGTDPVRYLVVPRLVAVALALPMLTMFADVIGSLGGYYIARSYGITHGTLVTSLTRYLEPYDVLVGLLKAFCFGLIIASVGSFRGLQTTGGADGVGRSTTGAVVTAIMLIIISNLLLDLLFF